MGGWGGQSMTSGPALGRAINQEAENVTAKKAAEEAAAKFKAENIFKNQQAADAAAIATADERRARGRAANLLTGNTGVSTGGATSRRMLLGS